MNRRDQEQELQLQLTTLEFLATVLRSEGFASDNLIPQSWENVCAIEEGKRIRARKKKEASRRPQSSKRFKKSA